MYRWPFIISNPHGGKQIPSSVRALSLLNQQQIFHDSDEQANDIYAPLKQHTQCYIAANTARAYVDLNRYRDDISKDGVVKTHTCWDEQIYRQPLDNSQVETLLRQHYDSYHAQLQEAIDSQRFKLLFDCHTMNEYPPPVAPDHKIHRPLVCLSDNEGKSCSSSLFNLVFDVFQQVFDGEVSYNDPFKGGFICSHYGQFLPCIQVELSQTDQMNVKEKSQRVHQAFEQIARLI